MDPVGVAGRTWTVVAEVNEAYRNIRPDECRLASCIAGMD